MATEWGGRRARKAESKEQEPRSLNRPGAMQAEGLYIATCIVLRRESFIRVTGGA